MDCFDKHHLLHTECPHCKMRVLTHTWFNLLGLESFFPTRPITCEVCPAVAGWSQGWRKGLASPTTYCTQGKGRPFLNLKFFFYHLVHLQHTQSLHEPSRAAGNYLFIPPKGIQIQSLLK